MNNYQLIFEGDLRLSLEGNNALLPVDQEHHKVTSFCIGSEDTSIVIRDHRSKSIIVQTPFLKNTTENFSEIFQQPAWAKVRYHRTDENMEIDLFDSKADGELPILWLGVLENNYMSGYKVDWEIFKSLSKDRTAFVALIP